MSLLSKLEMINLLGKGLVFLLQSALMIVFLYYMSFSVFGWFKRKNVPVEKFPIKNRFAVLVAAHNEELVVGNIIKNLKSLNYPKDMYDILVIADNCDDNTARVALENGALVYERFDDVKRGKGYSLEWMFEKIYKMGGKYDAVCIFDADNLASPNFLLEMNKQLCMGHKVIQGYLDSKNPSDSWIAANNSIAFWIGNRLFQLPRYYMGLSCVLGGTGLVVSIDVLKDIGWGATCLTEDLEFTLKLVLKGMKVYWAHDAIIYDEKPLTLQQSWKQRTRWMQGQCDCIIRFFKDLLVKGFRDKDFTAFDIALYLIQPIIAVINSIVMISGVISLICNHYRYSYNQIYYGLPQLAGSNLHYYGSTGQSGSILTITLTTFFMLYINIFFLIIEKKLTFKTFIYFITYPFYNFTWIPIIIQGFFKRNNKEWVHTLHTRVLDINDVESLEKAI
jgi:cellulose synthase/poly-beta-1,6-N-acetylglucosamine synthase-like glycosyltransferase